MEADSTYFDLDDPVSMIMETKLVTLNTDDFFGDMERKFVSSGCRFMPVMDVNGKCFGVVSTADLLRFQRQQIAPRSKQAWEMCNPGVVEVPHNASIGEATRLMVKNSIYHIVVNRDSRLAGIVSMTDIVCRCLLQEEPPGDHYVS